MSNVDFDPLPIHPESIILSRTLFHEIESIPSHTFILQCILYFLNEHNSQNNDGRNGG